MSKIKMSRMTVKQKIIKTLVEQPDHVLTSREIFEGTGHGNRSSVNASIYYLRDEGKIEKINTSRGPAWHAIMHKIREPTSYLHGQVETMVHEILKYSDFSSDDMDKIVSEFKTRFEYLKPYELRASLRLLGSIGEKARDMVKLLMPDPADPADPTVQVEPVEPVEPAEQVEPVEENEF